MHSNVEEQFNNLKITDQENKSSTKTKDVSNSKKPYEEEDDDEEEDEYFAEIAMSKAKQYKKFDYSIPFPSRKKLTKEDFDYLCILGKGAYAKVVKSKHKTTNEVYAIKMTEKLFIEKEMKIYQIYLENALLLMLNHPFIIKIIGIYHDISKVYIVLEYCTNGDFSDFINKNMPFTIEMIQFYIAEIVCALEYLYLNNVMHRDFKPENIMLDENMHIKIIDFGTAKMRGKIFDKEEMKFIDITKDTQEENDNKDISTLNRKSNMKRDTFVGTAEYVSPEMLGGKVVTGSADLWSLGCIIYKILTGSTPFKDKSEYLIFKRIKEQDYNFPQGFPDDAADLIKKLLILDPEKRLGASTSQNNDFNALKSHSFFKGVNFNNLHNTQPPIKKNITPIQSSHNYSNSVKLTNLNNNSENPKLKVKDGIIEKKSPYLHYNTRRVVLYTDPKIEYLEPKKNELKGTIYLSKACKANFVSKDKFEVVTPERTFLFRTEENEAGVWAKDINETILQYAA